MEDTAPLGRAWSFPMSMANLCPVLTRLLGSLHLTPETRLREAFAEGLLSGQWLGVRAQVYFHTTINSPP